MDPVSLVLKVLTVPITKMALARVNKSTMRYRVARAVNKRANAELNVATTRRMIQLWLKRPDVRSQLAVGGAQTIDDFSRLVERSSNLAELLDGFAHEPWHSFKTMTDLPTDGYLAPLDMAASRGTALWCDDAILRQLASRYSVKTFDTVDVLRYLAKIGRIDQQLLRAVEAGLIHEYYVDLGFEQPMLELAAGMAGWRPEGVACAISRQAAWVDPAATVRFAFRAAERASRTSLQHFQGWVAATALGLVRITADASQASNNLAIMLLKYITAGWLRSDQLPAVLSATRLAVREVDGLEDPLESVLRMFYPSLVQQFGHSVASNKLRDLFGFTNDADRLLAVKVIVTLKDR